MDGTRTRRIAVLVAGIISGVILGAIVLGSSAAASTWHVTITAPGGEVNQFDVSADDLAVAEDAAWAELRAASTTDAVDTTPPAPNTTLDSFAVNANNSITFGWTATPGAQVLCNIDSWPAPKDCTAAGKPNPRTTSPLPAGDRTLTLTAVKDGVSDPTPTVRNFTVGSPPPPPPDDAPPYLSNFIYPRNVGQAGTHLPENPGPGIADFDALDYCCLHDANTINDRMDWVADPGGSGKTVTQIRLVNGDNADGSNAPSGYRSEIYSVHRDLDNHEVGWQVLGFRLPSGNPGGQYGIFQNHAVGDARQNTPPQNLNVLGNGSLALGIRKIGVNRVMHTIGSAAPNVWHYVALHIRFSSGNDGFVEAWESDGSLPNVAATAPAFSDHGYSTLNGGSQPSRSHIGFYQSNFTGTIFYCGYHRSATYAEARVLPNCPVP